MAQTALPRGFCYSITDLPELGAFGEIGQSNNTAELTPLEHKVFRRGRPSAPPD